MSNIFNFNNDYRRNSGPYNFNFGVSGKSVYYLIAGKSLKFTSVWADVGANINKYKLYVGTFGDGASFSVIDLNKKVLIDNYLIDNNGNNGDFLDREDIVDINVSIEGL